MVMLYSVTAMVTRTTAGWTSTTNLPTFYLNPNVQGIVSRDHADKIARRLVRDAAGPDAEVSVYVTEEDIS